METLGHKLLLAAKMRHNCESKALKSSELQVNLWRAWLGAVSQTQTG